MRTNEVMFTRLTDDQKTKLDQILEKAGAPLSSSLDCLLHGRGAMQTVIEAALRGLISAKVHSASTPRFRAMVSGDTTDNNLRRDTALRKAMEELVILLPETDAFPPWAQMRAEFTEGASDSEYDSRCDEWDRRLHPMALVQALRGNLALMDRLKEKVGGTKPYQVTKRPGASTSLLCYKAIDAIISKFFRGPL